MVAGGWLADVEKLSGSWWLVGSALGYDGVCTSGGLDASASRAS